MKSLLTILFVLAGLAYSQSAFAQTSGDENKNKKAKKVSVDTTSNQKSGGTVNPSPAPGGSGGGITIDESGAPRPKKKKTSNAAPGSGTPDPAPKGEADKQAAEKSSGTSKAEVPSDLAIDEGGATTPTKAKPVHSGVKNSPGSDSISTGPATEVKPK